MDDEHLHTMKSNAGNAPLPPQRWRMPHQRLRSGTFVHTYRRWQMSRHVCHPAAHPRGLCAPMPTQARSQAECPDAKDSTLTGRVP
eukprot:359460-Chlamydomonas_euryale.AAC.4